MGICMTVSHVSWGLRASRLLLCVLALGLCSLPADAQPASSSPKIIIQFDTNTLTDWKAEFGNAIKRYLAENTDRYPNVRVTYDFLNVNYFEQGQRPEALINNLKFVHQADPADFIISEITFSNTNLFMDAYGEEVYPGVPFIDVIPFGNGIGNPIGPENENRIDAIGGIEAPIANSIQLIPQLMPDLEQLYVITGNADIAAVGRNIGASALENLPETIEVLMLNFSPFDRLLEQVSSLPANSAIFVLSADNVGGFRERQAMLARVREQATAPVFSYNNASGAFQEDYVGGNFVDPAAAGEMAIKKALNFLYDEGQELSDLVPTAYQINMDAVRKWGMDSALIPEGANLLNRNQGPLALYRMELFVLAAVFFALIMLTVFFRQSARSLAKQRTLFAAVIDSIPDAIFLTDQDDRIYALNAGARTQFGLSAEAAIGNDIGMLLPYAVYCEECQSPGFVHCDGEPQSNTFITAAGHKFPGESLSKPIVGSGGEDYGHVTLIRNISKRLMAEQSEQQREKMEALGNLVGGIAHDFNNVLGVISGYAQLYLVDPNRNNTQRTMNKVLEATERARSLVSQIISFSRDKNVEKQPVELHKVLQDTMNLLTVSVPKHINLETQVEAGLPAVLGAEVQIQQILMNLVTNSYQALGTEAGNIRVRIHEKEFLSKHTLSHGSVDAGHYNVLTVSDDGPGMSEDTLVNAFDPFFTTKAKGEGSGMGLAIVYNLVRSHGAAIDVETSPGLGTSFHIYFAQHMERRHSPQGREQSNPAIGEGQRILLVDDEGELLTVQQQLLSSLGFEVDAFQDPTKALTSFKQDPEHYDLVFSDENMPKITGIQLLEQIQQIKPGIPGIICTGYGDALNVPESDDTVLFGVLRKPFTLSEVSNLLVRKLHH